MYGGEGEGGEYCKKADYFAQHMSQRFGPQLVRSSLTTWEKQREVSGFWRRRHGEHAGPVV